MLFPRQNRYLHITQTWTKTVALSSLICSISNKHTFMHNIIESKNYTSILLHITLHTWHDTHAHRMTSTPWAESTLHELKLMAHRTVFPVDATIISIACFLRYIRVQQIQSHFCNVTAACAKNTLYFKTKDVSMATDFGVRAVTPHHLHALLSLSSVHH